MTLEDVLNLASEEQNAVLILYDGGSLRAKAETLNMALAGDVLNRKVLNIEARESALWVWPAAEE